MDALDWKTLIALAISSGTVGAIVTALSRRQLIAASVRRLLLRGKTDEAETETLVESTYGKVICTLERRLLFQEHESLRLEKRIRSLKVENASQAQEMKQIQLKHQRCEETQVELRMELASLRAHHNLLAQKVALSESKNGA